MDLRNDNFELAKKITAGLKLSVRRFYEQKAANNDYVIIGDHKGGVIRVPAKELLKEYTKD